VPARSRFRAGPSARAARHAASADAARGRRLPARRTGGRPRDERPPGTPGTPARRRRDAPPRRPRPRDTVPPLPNRRRSTVGPVPAIRPGKDDAISSSAPAVVARRRRAPTLSHPRGTRALEHRSLGDRLTMRLHGGDAPRAPETPHPPALAPSADSVAEFTSWRGKRVRPCRERAGAPGTGWTSVPVEKPVSGSPWRSW